MAEGINRPNTVGEGLPSRTSPISRKEPPMENTPFIHIENLSYSYVGEDEKPIPVLKNLSLDIREGV